MIKLIDMLSELKVNNPILDPSEINWYDFHEDDIDWDDGGWGKEGNGTCYGKDKEGRKYIGNYTARYIRGEADLDNADIFNIEQDD